MNIYACERNQAALVDALAASLTAPAAALVASAAVLAAADTAVLAAAAVLAAVDSAFFAPPHPARETVIIAITSTHTIFFFIVKYPP